MSGAAALIIISNVPPNRELPKGRGHDIVALSVECQGLANDVIAEAIDLDLTDIADAVSATPQDWAAANVAITALGVTRPYVQQS